MIFEEGINTQVNGTECLNCQRVTLKFVNGVRPGIKLLL
jgi:hypothetical protein